MFQKMIASTLLVLSATLSWAQSQSSEILKKKIEQISRRHKADIGISVVGPGTNDQLSLNGDKFYPMLSTVKFPIALTVLHLVEKGSLAMDQQLFIAKDALLPATWSPFRDKHPGGNISITVEEALMWMMSYSDNNIMDILLKQIGGAKVVQDFMSSDKIVVKHNEAEMHKKWEAEFVNTIKPEEATRLLQQFYSGKILNKAHTQWLHKVMVDNRTGGKRLKGRLPASVTVAAKTGTSSTNTAGLTGEVNDIGILSFGKETVYITVFVHNTYEKKEDAEALIADIAKEVYAHYHK